MQYRCSVCQIRTKPDDEHKPLDAVSHGYCKEHLAIAQKEIDMEIAKQAKQAEEAEAAAEEAPMTIYRACRLILDECKNEYAMSYARALEQAAEYGGDEALRVQALYLLSNISHWRGGHSKEVRAFLKEYTKGL